MKIHFIGIGGIGLSAIAKFLLSDKHTITGSDIKATKITEGLEALGIRVTVPHDPSALDDDHDLVIYSAAVKEDNCELIEAQKRGIKIWSRAEALTFVLQAKKVYSVCGAHGKSTTTGILAACLQSSALIGAESKEFDSNARVEEGDLMAFEADESDGSFLNSNPYCAIILNCEPEHMEFYHYDYEKFYDGYRQFAMMAPHRILNAEDPFLSTLTIDAHKVYPSKDIQNLRFEVRDGEPKTVFEFKSYGEFEVWGFGEHIALDAALAIEAASHELSLEAIRSNIKNFKGNKKRFDILVKNHDYVLIDDYGHHPTEVEATLKSAQLYANLYGLSRITALWQPHKWSRTLDNLDHFIRCFEGVDELIILPVWRVNEPHQDLDFGGLFGRYNPILAHRVKRQGDKLDLLDENSSVIKTLDQGLVISFGAGDITYQLRGLK